MKVSYGDAILQAFQHVMTTDEKCFCIGQGLWSPWYVGRTMDGLDGQFGRDRVIDTPVSENATTAIALGAALHGYRPIVIHPRMDFMILAADAMVNQAAKWRHMLGGHVAPSMVVRGIINRGGEQGAQHSQALHAWYAHIPGLRVVMPATAADARDLLIAAVQSPDPVVYIDDRWLYDWEGELQPCADVDLAEIGPRLLRTGSDITIVAAGYSVRMALEAADILAGEDIECEIVDLRVLNPLSPDLARRSVVKTGRLIAVDGGWSNCGLAAEIIASVVEGVAPDCMRAAPRRITLPDAPAPTSKVLEAIYYPTAKNILEVARGMFDGGHG